jgi:lipopolysaccharide assembly protein A
MLRLVLVGIALLLGLAFHSRNHQAVTLDFYASTIELPLSWLVVAALIIGALLGALTLLPRLLSVRRALRRELKRAQILAQAAPPTSPTDGH